MARADRTIDDDEMVDHSFANTSFAASMFGFRLLIGNAASLLCTPQCRAASIMGDSELNPKIGWYAVHWRGEHTASACETEAGGGARLVV